MPARSVKQLAAAGILALASACSSNAAPHADAPIPPESIRTEERILVDASRATPAKSGFAGAPDRTLATRLWYAPEAPRTPACGRDGCALVVLAHGFGGSTARFDAIARDLAGRGYVVAAPTFPLTSERAPGGHLTGIGDLLSQPGDVSFVIDELIAASAAPDDVLHGRVDGERIGVVGHSMGGATLIALSRLACCTDPRVDAVALVAPATFLVGMFGEEIAPHGAPMLAVTGDADPVVRSGDVRALHEALEPPRVYVELAGANHVDLIENTGDPSPNLIPTERATAAFFAAYLSGDFTALAPELDALAAEGHTVAADE